MTVAEAVQKIPNTNARTVAKWCQTGVLDAVKVPRLIRQPLGRGPKSGVVYQRKMKMWDIDPASVTKLLESIRSTSG